MEVKKIFLPESEMPRQWYNLAADLPTPMLPPLGPDGNPIGPEMLAPVFPMNLIEQEVSTERWIDIPEDVLRVLRIWRPSPLVRAFELEKALDTPARIYYKYEGVSPAGSHKPNTAIAQAYFNKKEGVKRLATETGAGQWGSALSMCCAFFGLEGKVELADVELSAPMVKDGEETTTLPRNTVVGDEEMAALRDELGLNKGAVKAKIRALKAERASAHEHVHQHAVAVIDV